MRDVDEIVNDPNIDQRAKRRELLQDFCQGKVTEIELDRLAESTQFYSLGHLAHVAKKRRQFTQILGEKEAT